MVVWFTAQDGHGTIDLFGEEEPYHFVGERHP